MPETIRQHLDRAVWFSDMGRSGSATKEIKAALDILDNAERSMIRMPALMVTVSPYGDWVPTDRVLIPDPKEAS